RHPAGHPLAAGPSPAPGMAVGMDDGGTRLDQAAMSGTDAIRGWVPGLRAVSTYRRSWLGKDLVAGLVLSTLLVPQGMAYAELAGLPAITGLYTTILCLAGYALFGPSRILVLGP